MKILSIDWDYFMNCSADMRAEYFPDSGNEDTPSALSSFIWASRYAYAETAGNKLTGIKPRNLELDKLKKVVDLNADKFVYAVADSHKHLGEFILNPDMEEKFKEHLEIVNIDHHHDMYNVSSDLNCGNWINKVLEKFPDAKVTWIKNSDSDVCPDGISATDDFSLVAQDYDMIYLCRSGQWSCPHLDKEFGALNRYIARRAIAAILRQEIPNRWDSDMQKAIKDHRITFAQAMKSLAETDDTLISDTIAVGNSIKDE